MYLEGKLSLQTDSQLYILDFDTFKLEEIRIQEKGRFTPPIWSHDGTKILDVPSSDDYRNLYVYNKETGEKTIMVSYEGQETTIDVAFPSFSWSPDDEQIAFVSYSYGDWNSEINILNLENNKITNISNNPAADESPNWSPDGEKIAFVSDRSGSLHIYVMNSDGSRLHRITPSGFPEVKESIWRPYLREPTWSPDGKKLAFVAPDKNDELELFVIDPDGSNLIQLTHHSDEFSFLFENNVVWSPDSTKLVFSAYIDSPIWNLEIFTVDVYTQEITRMTFDDEDNVSYDYNPLWTDDGNVILFISGRVSGKTQKDRLFAIDLLNGNKLIPLYDFPFDLVYHAEVLP